LANVSRGLRQGGAARRSPGMAHRQEHLRCRGRGDGAALCQEPRRPLWLSLCEPREKIGFVTRSRRLQDRPSDAGRAGDDAIYPISSTGSSSRARRKASPTSSLLSARPRGRSALCFTSATTGSTRISPAARWS
jgi:hypothetical protein